jgi:hypothetical protein
MRGFMHRPGWGAVLALGVMLPTFARTASAGIMFAPDNGTGNSISFSDPTVVGGDMVAKVTINMGPTKMPRADGFEIVDFSYTFESVNGVEVDATWFSSRMFDINPGSKVRLRIFGNTTITQGALNVTNLFVDGLIDGRQPPNSGFISEDQKGALNAKEITWDKQGSLDVAAGNGRVLGLNSGVVWLPARAGEKLTVSSRYAVTLQAVPEPSALVLVGLGVPCLWLLGKHRNRA